MRTILAFLFMASSLLAAEPRVTRDLAYAQPKNAKHTLDVYAPVDGQNLPIVFWIHGGGWRHGDKSEMAVKPQAFVDQGYVFVTTNYRLLPDVTIKQIAEDLAKSIRWTHEHAKEYGGDPDQIFVMGHSAGAHLAALLCTDHRYLKAEGLSLAILKGCVPVDGDTFDVPLQIATESAKSAAIHTMKFGDIEKQTDLSPVTHVAKDKSIPPFLILHVADDPLTTRQAKRLAEALQDVEVTAKPYPAEAKSHTTINAELGQPGDKPTQAVFEFMAEVLKK